MTIPSVITAYNKLKETLQLLGPLEAAKIQANIAEKASRKANIKSLIDEAIATIALVEAKQAELQQRLLVVQMLGPENACNMEEVAVKNSLAATDAQLALQEKILIALKEEEAAATETLTTAQAGLNTTLLLNPFTIAIAAIGALIFIFQQYTNSIEEARKKHQEMFNELKQESTSLNNSIENFNNLYKTYLDTGEASDELKNSTKELCDQLGIANSDAMLAADNFIALKKAIEEANNAKLDDLINSAEKVIKDNEYVGGLGHYLNSQKFTLPGFDNLTGENALNDERIRNVLSETKISSGENDLAVIKKIDERITELKKYKDEVEKELKATTDENKKKILNESLKSIEKTLIPYEELSQDEAYNKTKEAIQTIIESRSKNTEFQEQFKDKTDVSEILSTLASDKNETISGFFNDSSLTELQKVEQALSMITEDSAHAALGIKQVELSLEKTKKNIDFSEILKGIKIEDQFKIAGAIDKDKTESQIKDDLKKIVDRLNNGEDLEVILKTIIQEPSGAEFGKVAKYTQEQIEAIFKKADMEDIPLQDYLDSFLEKGGAGISSMEDEFYTVKEALEEYQKQIEETKSSINNLDDSSENYDEQLANLNRKLKAYEKQLSNAKQTLEDLAVAELETNNGLDDLATN